MPRIAQPAKTLLRDDEIYVFQTKCNLKQPIHGGIYNWHQDFGHWQHDGIPTPQTIDAIRTLAETESWPSVAETVRLDSIWSATGSAPYLS